MQYFAGQQAAITLDPRTKLLLLVVVNTVALGGGSNVAILVAAIVAAAYLFTVERGKYWWWYVLGFAALYSWSMYGGLLSDSVVNLMLVMSLYWIARFSVAIAIGLYVVRSTGVTELGQALRALKIPRNVVTSLQVFLRFIPTILEEITAIRDAQRLRGIRTNPLRVNEFARNFLVPLLSSVTRVADELAASGMVRGLGRPNPTELVTLRFGVADAATMAVVLMLLIVRYVL